MQHLLSLAHQFALPFIIVISVVVFVHEFGHYWVARRCGVKVESFSLGFGRKIFGWTDKHGTQWKASWLPLGGYVKMFGDADAASSPDESVKTMTEEEKKISFYHQPVLKRMAIVVAGPAFNYLFAIIVLAVLFMAQGQPYTSPTASAVVENGVAAQAGVLPGDTVLSIDGQSVERFEDIKRIISLNQGEPVSMEIDRAGQNLTLRMTPEVSVQKDRFGGEHRIGKIGLMSTHMEYKKWPALKAVAHATTESWRMSVDTVKAIGQMIAGTRGSEEIGGPLRIAEMSGHVAEDGAWALIWFMAIISINLGLINLFPVPMLDGGHVVFYAYEYLIGKPMPEKAQEIGLRIGLTMVVSLMVFATWNDLVHLQIISKIVSLFS